MRDFPTFQKIPFTAAAFAKMQQEVVELQEQEKQVLERLKVAREMGDLSENGAYKYAKFELGNVRRKLRRLQRLLSHGEVVEAAKNPDTIGFGATVMLRELSRNRQVSYTLVSKHESDPQKGFLSQESPLGRALLGHRIGDTVDISVPAGQIQYEILQIS